MSNDGRVQDQWPSVCAIVLNWNLADQTIRCVETIASSTYPRVEVVVIDNGSTDSSVDRIRSAHLELTVLSLPENRGFAAGMNVGIRHALATGADWILLVNNDAELAPNTLQDLLEACPPGVAVAMPRIDRLPGHTFWHAGARRSRLTGLPTPVREADLADGHPLIVDYVVGCVLLIDAHAFESVGLFDERYYMYYEDLDFSLRLGQAGYRMISVPRARAWHWIGASLRSDSSRRSYLQTRYRVVWCRSRPHPALALWWWLSLSYGVLRDLVRAFQSLNLAAGRAILDGLRDGLKQPLGTNAAGNR